MLVMMTVMRHWPAFNGIYTGCSKPESLQVRSVFGVPAHAPGVPIEIECMPRCRRGKS